MANVEQACFGSNGLDAATCTGTTRALEARLKIRVEMNVIPFPTFRAVGCRAHHLCVVLDSLAAGERSKHAVFPMLLDQRHQTSE